MEKKIYHVYILTNMHNNVLYIGVTSRLKVRIQEHKQKLHPKSFTAKYNVSKLVYFETYKYVNDALEREKILKAGPRKKKIELVSIENPEFKDLAQQI